MSKISVFPKYIWTVDNNWTTHHEVKEVKIDEDGKRIFICKFAGKDSLLFPIYESVQKVFFTEEEAEVRINPNERSGFR